MPVMFVNNVQIYIVFTFLFWYMLYVSVTEMGILKSPTTLGIYLFFRLILLIFFYLFGAFVIR